MPRGVLKRFNVNFLIYFIKKIEHSLCGPNSSINWYLSITGVFCIPLFQKEQRQLSVYVPVY